MERHIFVFKYFRFYKYVGIYSQDAVVTESTASYKASFTLDLLHIEICICQYNLLKSTTN
jgi:hypothetical protein